MELIKANVKNALVVKNANVKNAKASQLWQQSLYVKHCILLKRVEILTLKERGPDSFIINREIEELDMRKLSVSWVWRLLTLDDTLE